MIKGLRFTTKGSKDSGNFGHSGRPGSVGGSTAGGGRKYVAPDKVPEASIMWESSGWEEHPTSIEKWRELARKIESTPMPVAPTHAYHLTSEKNIARIMSKGLKPGKPHWPSLTGKESVSFSLSQESARKWSRSKPILLKIDLKGLNLFDFRHMVPNEVRVYSTIPPERISILD